MRAGVEQRDGAVVIPELPVTEVPAPLDIQTTRPVQRDVLGSLVLQLLAGRQNVIEGDVGVERELGTVRNFVCGVTIGRKDPLYGASQTALHPGCPS